MKFLPPEDPEKLVRLAIESMKALISDDYDHLGNMTVEGALAAIDRKDPNFAIWKLDAPVRAEVERRLADRKPSCKID